MKNMNFSDRFTQFLIIFSERSNKNSNRGRKMKKLKTPVKVLALKVYNYKQLRELSLLSLWVFVVLLIEKYN